MLHLLSGRHSALLMTARFIPPKESNPYSSGIGFTNVWKVPIHPQSPDQEYCITFSIDF
jgi:hypothetical protein